MSESQTCATVVTMSTSRRIIGVRSIAPGRAVQADEEHPSSAARAGDRRGGRVRRAARLDHDVEADAVAELEQQLGQVVARRRSPSRCAPSADAVASRSSSMSIATTRPSVRAARCARDDERADAAGADHRDGVVRTAARRGRARAGRRRAAASWPPRRRRTRRGRRGRSPPATSRTRPARRRPAGPSVRYSAHRFVRPREAPARSDRTRSPHPRRPGRRRGRPVTSSPSVDDAPDELVPEHDARAAEDRAVIPLRGVRAADRRADHLEHDLVRRGRGRVGDVLDADVVRPVEDGRPHALSTRSGP